MVMRNDTDNSVSTKCPVVTSVKQSEVQEVRDIINAVDEYLFYEGGTEITPRPLARPSLVISSLIQVLVSKNLINLSDVKRALVGTGNERAASNADSQGN